MADEMTGKKPTDKEGGKGNEQGGDQSEAVADAGVNFSTPALTTAQATTSMQIGRISRAGSAAR